MIEISSGTSKGAGDSILTRSLEGELAVTGKSERRSLSVPEHNLFLKQLAHFTGFLRYLLTLLLILLR